MTLQLFLYHFEFLFPVQQPDAHRKHNDRSSQNSKHLSACRREAPARKRGENKNDQEDKGLNVAFLSLYEGADDPHNRDDI